MRRSSLMEDLGELLAAHLIGVPVWVGPALAALVYVAVRYGLPYALSDAGPFAIAWVALARTFAVLAATFVIVCWLVAMVAGWQRRRLVGMSRTLADLRELSWQQFEALVGEVYRRRGFHVEETGSAAGDGGVDLILRRGHEKVLVQCKRWRDQNVGVKEVRELLGTVMRDRATSAILVTTSSFTDTARGEAKGQPIQLIDGEQLCALLSTVQERPACKARPAPVRDVGSTPSVDRPPSDGGGLASTAPLCPRCGRPMVLRMARKGAQAGAQFWGCSGYPRCKGARPAEKA